MNIKAANEFYQNLPRLETARLVLRKATQNDVPAIFVYCSDADVTRYLRWGPHPTLSVTEQYVAGVLQGYEAGQDGSWFIEHKDYHAVIGQIHMMEIDVLHQKAQVGFVLAKSHWNQGIMTEGLRIVLDYAFTQIGFNRLEGFCIAQNRAAGRAMEKSSMRKEGELHDYLFQKDRFWDFCVYAILRREFDSR